MLHVVPERIFEELEVHARKKNEASCDLLLGRLFQFHPEEAAAVLKGVAPRVVDSDEPFIKKVVIVAPDQNSQVVPIRTLSGKPTVALIMKVCAEHFKSCYEEMLSHRRNKKIVRPRQVAMYLAKTLTMKSLPEIGRLMGGRDHTTILYGARRIENDMREDNRLTADIAAVCRRLSEIIERK